MLLLRSTRLAGIAVLLTSTSALAQVTPEDVWAIWQENALAGGYTLTAETTRRDGDRLILGNVVAAIESETVKTRVPMSELVMRDRGDGTVEVLTPREIEFTTLTIPDGGELPPVETEIALEQDGLTIVVSGTREAPRSEFTATSIAATFGSSPVVEDGEQVEVGVHMTLNGVKGGTVMGAGEVRPVTSTLDAETFEIAVAGTGSAEGSTLEALVSGEKLSGRLEGMMPRKAGADDTLGQMMAAGLRGKGGYTTGPMDVTVAMSEGEDITNITATIATSAVDLEVGPVGMGYTSAATGITLGVEGSSVPFPDMNFTLAEYRIGGHLPAVKSDQPVDFGAVLRLVDLKVPDSLLDMFDPAKRLARDPASVILEAKGKMRLLVDLDAMATSAPEATSSELHSLDITALQLKAAGADLTGTGSFTFDNTDLETFGGMPRPAGGVDLKLVGGNGLLDNLVAMGLVPEDQVMVARMMIAMFARPGDGPDTLVSRIEVTPDGQVTANGQRIQ